MVVMKHKFSLIYIEKNVSVRMLILYLHSTYLHMYVLLVYSGILPTKSRRDPFVSLIDRQLAGFGLRV